MDLGCLVLGFPGVYLKGMRITIFRLSGFCKPVEDLWVSIVGLCWNHRAQHDPRALSAQRHQLWCVALHSFRTHVCNQARAGRSPGTRRQQAAKYGIWTFSLSSGQLYQLQLPHGMGQRSHRKWSDCLLGGSWDLVARVINKITILVLSYNSNYGNYW